MTGSTLHPHRPYADTSVPPADPVHPRPQMSMLCDDCPMWTFGAATVEDADRPAEHRKRCHG